MSIAHHPMHWSHKDIHHIPTPLPHHVHNHHVEDNGVIHVSKKTPVDDAAYKILPQKAKALEASYRPQPPGPYPIPRPQPPPPHHPYVFLNAIGSSKTSDTIIHMQKPIPGGWS